MDRHPIRIGFMTGVTPQRMRYMAQMRATETFHDGEGAADMYEAMKAYIESSFAGPMRPDHGRGKQRPPRLRPPGPPNGRRLHEGPDGSYCHAR